MNGIWSAVPTPVTPGLEPDTARAVTFYRELLDRGCDGINVLGTTGQAMSFDVASRRALMEAVATNGIAGTRVMTGTGAASLRDTIALTRTAHTAGFAGALVMPPFFYRDASDDGILQFFDRLLTATTGSVLLYNFPKMSGIAFSVEIVERLLGAFPGRIVGIKDSSNDKAYQRAIVARFPSLAVFPGSENYLLEALDYGAAGCISGSVALWAPLASAVFRERDVAAAARLTELRDGIEGPLIPHVHARIAAEKNDDAWKRVVPPLVSRA